MKRGVLTAKLSEYAWAYADLEARFGGIINKS